MNQALAVVCLFIYIFFVGLFQLWNHNTTRSSGHSAPLTSSNNHNCYIFFYIVFFLVCLHYLFECSSGDNMEYIFICCLHINKIFNKVWIKSSLSCCLLVYIDIVCLFVCIDFVCLFVYIFYINNQLVPKAWAYNTSLLNCGRCF